ncbi:uncharacterized protein GGS22DRAFT_98508 [Annulohypoxylon maeteangense]|uniref:uncharacterized protein n=1 Tax=Annulohypoxylon maeteangense TaxID=1927788 RepID=UPI0020073A00|nr:uncharacterized protein GGS22DRAFT_98508 [Annulohypoxylon maeteangense]KAI0888529.1 hypothetical protein GGS22DRAFT_98508 [Annulohypoxylon maeteangense]
MNRFRTKKKVKDEISAPRPSQDSESSIPFRPFRKGKKTQEPEKIEIDLSTALPSNDEFRTSLLMTGLSARFSMLREQDDPSTKIGKASDDSVLFPKRQSRLDYGGFRGLGDIAEVESIRAAAPFSGKDLSIFDDGDSFTASSVMGRSKPIEGNNLFGGRQKIYKIPVGTNPAKTPGGGMGGRALYDDDVALSAFQKWRQAERERKSSEEDRGGSERRNSGEMEIDVFRAESPILSNYNQKRETSSTTSSIPSLARNSTAATSVTSSHRAPSLKEWQPSASSGPAVDRSVTRTRRLYESGLNNDLHEQQSSALSRIDTLTRQRTFGTRTPDLAQNSPSPTTIGFVERFAGERKILAKSSAPNLRSMSPPTTASSADTPDLGVRVPSVTEMRSNFGGAPPLSPPISETEENSILSIHPNDRGKATALGVFQKPLQPYDESRYAQRQLQRQQGRETPTLKSRDDTRTSLTNQRSSSSSSARSRELESHVDATAKAAKSSSYEEPATSFLADPNDSDCSPAVSPKPAPSPQVFLRRPSDREHPAFRDSTIMTPLSLDSKSSDGTPQIAENPSSLSPNPREPSPADSPTLGPAPGAGLSGMVRQHLRGDSNASSIYGMIPPTSGFESRFPADSGSAEAFHELGTTANPWDMSDAGRDWTLDLDVNEPMPDAQFRFSNVPDSEDLPGIIVGTIPNTSEEDRDEFASQLADGARRVRERLTTYVETDSRSASPSRLGDSNDSFGDQPPPPRQNGLGLLRPKNSRGSLIDRSRDASQSKAMKMLGLGASSNSQVVSSAREPPKEESGKTPNSFDYSETEDKADNTDEAHAGLRAFRQARRELQKMREQETQARHHQQEESAPDSSSVRSTPSKQRPSGRSSLDRGRKPPPIFYKERSTSEELTQGSRDFVHEGQTKSDGDKSGSDSGNDGQANSWQTRPMNSSSVRGNLQVGLNGTMARPPMRSPGLPGTDIKRSPIMPPRPYPGSTQTKQSSSTSNVNLHVHTARSYEPSQVSPASPIPSPFPHNPSTPLALPSSPRPSASPNRGQENGSSNISDAMRRKIKTKDISDPTFVMSTSRVPTMDLPDAPRNRSRSNSRTAPPLPPINPRRRQDFSSTRAVFDNLSRRNDGGFDNSVGHVDRDDPRPERRRLRSIAPDAPSMQSKAPNNQTPINVGPPAPRQAVTQGAKHPGMNLPGGMI